jgi:hypothetical protein
MEPGCDSVVRLEGDLPKILGCMPPTAGKTKTKPKQERDRVARGNRLRDGEREMPDREEAADRERET